MERSWDEMVEVILGEEKEGKKWLKKVEEWRGIGCKGEGVEKKEWEYRSESED